ncbi:MAG TPA: amine dehydrogenase large subunit [Steroidobacteraceae bacterium]|nr:amine dehydrogenase large subunit [Steroidobacteraceae bacterium]
MSVKGLRTASPVILGVLVCAPLLASPRFAHPLPPEKLGTVATLPAKYPSSWAFLDYASERIEIRDVGDDTRAVEGDVQARDSTTMLIPDDRPEFYTADTVWSRYTRGTRTDYITVYDKRTLDPIGEIVLPGAKRALITAMQGMFEFTDRQRLGLVFNFTPAASVTVVDLVHRKVLRDIDIPGCSLIFPSGKIGFSTLCASGTVFSLKLDATGRVMGHAESQPFNHLGRNPLFTSSTMIDGVRYFVTMRGDVQPLDMRHAYAKVLTSWPLVTAAERAAHWRPSGWQLVTSDGRKDLYVLMQAHAHEGTQKSPADEVWVYDVATKQRLRRLRLVRPGSSIALTHAASPLLLVQAGERLDVYDPRGGGLIRSMGLPGLHTRLLIEPVR